MSTRKARPSIKSLVLEYLEQSRPSLVDERELASIRKFVRGKLEPHRRISDRYLLDILLETKVEIARSLGGLPLDLRGRVHFRDPEVAASSLRDLESEYRHARQQGDFQRAEDCRRVVRQAKDRLKMLLRRTGLDAKKKTEKEELLRWFVVWLETPELFSQWLDLRQRAKEKGQKPISGNNRGSDVLG